MAKYNINLGEEKEPAAYSKKINPKTIKRLKTRITDIMLKKKKYKDNGYTVKQLAADLDTNTRYISSALKIGYNMNYTSFVNMCRVKDAAALLADRRYRRLKMEDVSDMAGFSNRQSFYAAFYKFTGATPRQYKLEHSGLSVPEEDTHADTATERPPLKNKTSIL